MEPSRYAFALFDWQGKTVAAYGVHLKSNLARGDQLRGTHTNIYKRELAAQQLIKHVGQIEKKTGAPTKHVVACGDYNTSPDDLHFASEGTLGTFAKAGFVNPIMKLPPDQRITLPGEGR